MSSNVLPIYPTFHFRALQAVSEIRSRHFQVQGRMVNGLIRSGTRVWVHVPGGATEADLVEIVSDDKPVPEARVGPPIGLLLRGGRSLARIAAGTGISDSPNFLDPPPTQWYNPTWKDYKGPEALDWLRTAPNGDDNSFASNRFHGTENAIRFVESLYAAGAERVIIDGEHIVDEGGGDLYADALVVLLPTAPAARDRVVGICKPEWDREEGIFTSDEEWDTGDCVFLWWD